MGHLLNYSLYSVCLSSLVSTWSSRSYEPYEDPPVDGVLTNKVDSHSEYWDKSVWVSVSLCAYFWSKTSNFYKHPLNSWINVHCVFKLTNYTIQLFVSLISIAFQQKCTFKHIYTFKFFMSITLFSLIFQHFMYFYILLLET